MFEYDNFFASFDSHSIDDLELFTRFSVRFCIMETAGSPWFPQVLNAHAPCSKDPGQIVRPDHFGLRMLPPTNINTEAPTVTLISRLNDTAFEFAVYASQ